MEALESLQLIGRRQASWSKTANALKSTLDKVRWCTFALAVLGAILATIASQVDEPITRRWIAMSGAIVLGVGTFLTARLVSNMHVSAWVRARAASEALKRELYKFAARAAPYDGADPVPLLDKELAAIEDTADDLIGQLVEADKIGGTPVEPMTSDEYVAKRVEGQIRWYREKAEAFRKMSSRLRTAEFVLALLSTIITAAVGVMEKYPLASVHFDFAALTAILTTIGALVLTHIEACRYDFLVTVYRATARRLADALKGYDRATKIPSQQWSDFVEQCETIIAAENSSWVAKWSGK